MFVLDTNAVSELRKVGSPICDEKFAAWALSTQKEDLAITSITALELEVGVRRLERRDPRQGAVLRAWLTTQVWPAFEGRVLPFDREAAVVCAGLHVPDPQPERDSYIAAIALARDLTVVTRNVSDFAPSGVAVLNPWE